MCLECGSRLALDYQRPPSWRLPAAIVGLVLVLAGAAVAFALAQVSKDASKTSASVPVQPVSPAPPADTPPTAAQPTPSTPAPVPTSSSATPAPSGGTPAQSTPPNGPAPTGTTGPAAPTAPAAATGGWPPGKSAFTVVLASLRDKASADAKLTTAHAAGIAGAAILHSDEFPTLRPGYWVVFDGQFATIGEATQQANQDKGKPGFSDAYPRFVSKDANAKR
jgi:hypothetical protein